MPMIAFAIGGVLATIVGAARLWWLLRERSRRRREAAWRRWWRAYSRLLPAILMARWPRNRSLSHRPGLIS